MKISKNIVNVKIIELIIKATKNITWKTTIFTLFTIDAITSDVFIDL